MHGGKALLLIGVVALLVAAGVFYFVDSLRPAFVQDLFNKAGGYTKATSAEDALDKFRQAIDKRNYKAASIYLAGDYKEWFDKGLGDAEAIANEIDNLRHAMKKNGIKSGKADCVLFLLDPFPGGFKYTIDGKGDSVTAVLEWADEWKSHSCHEQTISGYRVDNRMWSSLLPYVVQVGMLEVTVKKESDGAWRIHIPVESGSSGLGNHRHLRDTVDYLRKNGSNFKNALESVKNDVKNNPTTKEAFETALKSKLEESK
jgi:hypothetical protein